MKKTFLLTALCLLAGAALVAQPENETNYLLWKVSGNGLKKPSYLFGTYHFLSNAFVDSLPQVKSAYQAAEAVIGELVIDSTIQQPMMEAALLKETTLKQLLPDTIYARANAWFKQEAGVGLANFDQFKPLTVLTVALAITQQKYFPNPPGQVQLDAYFQAQAKQDGKRVLGLETIDVQINALYRQISLQRQVELLADLFKSDPEPRQLISEMNKAYVSQDLEQLQRLMYSGAYTGQELKALLDDRNDHWMRQLPQLMLEQPVFVAVGALHLIGDSGLIRQLRRQGFTVTPVKTHNL